MPPPTSKLLHQSYQSRAKHPPLSQTDCDLLAAMASGPHTFITSIVFSAERFQGSPLAVVAVRANAIPPHRKALIAKEFHHPQTIFIHDAPGPGLPRRVDIYTQQGEELPFGGSAVLAAAHYIFTWCDRLAYRGVQDRDTQRQTTTVMTKIGPIPVFYNPYRTVAAVSMPHDLHIHKNTFALDDIINVQPQLRIVPTIDQCSIKTFPIISFVRGVTFGFVDFTETPDLLAALKASDAPEMKLDEGWAPSYVGCLYYKKKEDLKHEGEPVIHSLQARMITKGSESPGSGSACCALACYLALGFGTNKTSENTESEKSQEQDDLVKKTEQVKLEDPKQEQKLERHVYAFQQGVEMGRLCMIAVEVDLRQEPDGTKKVVNVTLSGRSSTFLKGELIGG